MLWIPWNYQGGGGFVGNRYFVSVYPAFIFLVPAVAATLAATDRLCARWPAGRAVVVHTVRLARGLEHVAGTRPKLSDPYFPLELSLRNVPGYETMNLGG